jgi:hypothetical protein
MSGKVREMWAKLGCWVAKIGRWMGAPACYGKPLGSNPAISKKYKMGDISKSVANTLYDETKEYLLYMRYWRHQRESIMGLLE